MEIMSIAIEGKKYFDELESRLEEHEVTIDKMEGHGRELLNLNKPPRNLLRRFLFQNYLE